jgi:hypothetical protein
MRRSNSYNTVALGLGWLQIALGCANSKPKARTLTYEERKTIQAALDSKNYPYADELEINDAGWLVATFQLNDRPASLQQFAEGTLITIREAALPLNIATSYRVTLNGPSPGTGLIRRYGSARFVEGDRVTWEPGN